MNRKSFLRKIVSGVLVGLPIISLWNCSDSSEDDSGMGQGSDKNCLANGTAVSIAGNHGHTLTVSKEDVDSGSEKTYAIAGSSGHDHSVTVTSTHFTALQNNTAITIESTSGNGHTHNVTVTCA